MQNVLILCAHRPKRSPSQRYRFEQYLPFLEENGFKFRFSYLLNEKDDEIFYSKGNLFNKAFILLKSFLIRLKDSFQFKKYDIIFIQREASFLGTSYFEKRAFRSGAYVIFDFDDSIWLADTSPGNKKWEWIKKPEKFYDNVSHAHCVIAGNAYLAEKAKPYNKNVIIIPTTINSDWHIPKTEHRNKKLITIGWSGSISTIKHFELLVPVLLKLQQKYPGKLKFKIIGDKYYKHPQLNIEAIEWKENTEVSELNSLDIGLMPLPNDEWANGKCGLKGLSYMACGVPTVMSTVGVNNDIIKNGENGFLINSENEWLEVLSKLIESADLRIEIGNKGRETVMKNYCVKAHKNSYIDVFKNAGANR
ncbi:MAG: glycosyltransferase family 4 protein [Bacteroidetes bacterium]|nr:glycosyltransferase family 4 protein [Bacteroidota bacterium]